MSYATTIRTRLEQLMLGETGTTYTMAAGRFHRRSPDRPLEQHPLDSIERAFEIPIDNGRPLVPINALDGFKLMEHRFSVRVAYAVTNAGGDLAELVGEQDGPGTLDAIRDRAATDVTDIETVLSWHENRSGLDPDVFDVGRTDADWTITRLPQVAVLEVPFLLRCRVTIPGSYAP